MSAGESRLPGSLVLTKDDEDVMEDVVDNELLECVVVEVHGNKLDNDEELLDCVVVVKVHGNRLDDDEELLGSDEVEVDENKVHDDDEELLLDCAGNSVDEVNESSSLDVEVVEDNLLEDEELLVVL